MAKVETDESFVNAFYDQAQEVFARNGYSVPFRRNRVLQLFRAMQESGNLLAISIRKPDDGAITATGIFLIEGQELYLWGWTHRTQYRTYHPTELLTWTAMKKAMEGRCTTFDMGGAGDTKVKFGAVPDETVYRWIRSRCWWLTWLRMVARKAFKYQQAFRGRLVQQRLFGARAGVQMTGSNANGEHGR